MAKDNMTIRFTPDGFSFFVGHDTEANVPFHEVAPGPDFHLRLQHEVLEVLPECETPPDLTVQIVSDRVILLPPHITDSETASLMYRATLSEPDAPTHSGPLSESAVEEQILLQPLTLPTGQRVVLCFGINRSLYLFLQRNFGDLTFEHHLSSLLIKAALSAAPAPLSSLAAPSDPAAPSAPASPSAPSSPSASPSQPSMAAPSRPASEQHPASPSQPSMAAHLTPQFLELALFRQGKLALVNVYRTSTPDNRAYYVLNTWMREGLDQLNDRLLILGSGTPATQLYTALQPFIKRILLQ